MKAKKRIDNRPANIEDMPIKRYGQAVKDGDLYYRTGKKCLRGHLTYRFTSTGNCVECDRLAQGKVIYYFFDGKKCPYGHIAKKRVDNGFCSVCYDELIIELKERFPVLSLWHKRTHGEMKDYLSDKIDYLESQIGKKSLARLK